MQLVMIFFSFFFNITFLYFQYPLFSIIDSLHIFFLSFSFVANLLPAKTNPPQYEVIVQGSKVTEINELLRDKYGFPFSKGKPSKDGKNSSTSFTCKFVEVIDGVKKK